MEQMDNNKAINLEGIFRAIKTYQTARGKTEPNGIVNAFAQALKEDQHCLVLMTKTMKNGKTDKAFVMMKDRQGNDMFPMYTDMEHILPVKQGLEKNNYVEIGTMNLRMLFQLLSEKQMCNSVIVNPFSQNFATKLNFFMDIVGREPRSHITLIEADLAALYTDAIVCPTDETISGSGESDKAIQAAGGDVFKAMVDLEVVEGTLDVADVAVIQCHGDLHAKYIFYTNIPEFSWDATTEDVFECYANCMTAARELGCKSIAFPCTSAAMKGMPKEIVIGAATKAVTTWLLKNPSVNIDVYFCFDTAEEKEFCQKYFDGMKK